jgi:hypothetical protein
MKSNIIKLLGSVLLFALLLCGCTTTHDAINSAETSNSGEASNAETEKTEVSPVIPKSSIVYLKDEEAIEIKVGTTLIFYEREVQSFPNRWIYLISDESLITVNSDKIENRPSANVAPGGGNEYREIEFIVMAPGECALSFRNSMYWHTDTAWDNDFLSERIYHIIITE